MNPEKPERGADEKPLTADEAEEARKSIREFADVLLRGSMYSAKEPKSQLDSELIAKIAEFGIEVEAKALEEMWGKVLSEREVSVKPSWSFDWYVLLAKLYKDSESESGARRALHAPWVAGWLKVVQLPLTISLIKVYVGSEERSLAELLGERRVWEIAEKVARSLSEDEGFATIVAAGAAHIDEGLRLYRAGVSRAELFKSYKWAIALNGYVTARILEEASKEGVLKMHEDRLAELRLNLVNSARSYLATLKQERNRREEGLAEAL